MHFKSRCLSVEASHVSIVRLSGTLLKIEQLVYVDIDLHVSYRQGIPNEVQFKHYICYWKKSIIIDPVLSWVAVHVRQKEIESNSAFIQLSLT